MRFVGIGGLRLHAAREERPYCFIGNGDPPMVHRRRFVFNQGILPKGAAYWVALTEGYLR